MKRTLTPCICLFFLLCAPSFLLFAYSDSDYDFPVLKGNFFVLMEPAGPLDPQVYDEKSALKQVLDEARYVFSAMIYGLRFSYIPKDNARGVAEEFTVEPVYSIVWGDPSLSSDGGRYKDGRYDATIRYQVREEQMPWIDSWETNTLVTTGGTGKGNLYAGYDGKIEAINNSIKEALRNYLRPRMYNKPRKITGTASFTEVPYITMHSGQFFCQSKMVIRFKEIQEYQQY